MKHAASDGPDIAFRLARRVVSAVADDMSTVQRVGAGAVAALVAITPFGAWNELEARADPMVTGTPVEVGPFEVTVLRAATADELAHLTPQPGNRLLAVVAEVTNTGDVPEYGVTLGTAIPAPADAGIVPETPLEGSGTGDGHDLPSASLFDIEDSTSLRVLNPGVPYEVALVWEQSATWPGDEIPVDLVELDWVEEDPLSLDDGHWSAAEVAYSGTVTLTKAAQR